MAKERKPENLAAGVARVFLGIRLECAQCHNHPFARWKREQFWSLAAFFAEVAPDGPENAVTARREPNAAPRRELTIPGTKKVVTASHLDGSTPAWRRRADTREILAEWVTAPDNPYFARAVVNRVWARFFGIGLIEPVDDLDAEAGSAELSGLLDELAGQFRAHGYNLKFLIRALTATRAYNLSSAGKPGRIDDAHVRLDAGSGPFARPALDSLTQATGADDGGRSGPLPGVVRQSRRTVDRGRDNDRPGADDDERVLHRRRHEPGDQRGARRDRQGPVP